MSRGIIFGVGLFALTLLAVFCIPRHLPSSPVQPARGAFHAAIDHGQLTLSGTVGSEEAKRAVLARAQDLAKTGRFRVTGEPTVAPGGDNASLESALPALVAHLAALQSPSASLTLTDQGLTMAGTAATGEIKVKVLRDVSALVGSSVTVQDQLLVASAAGGAAAPAPAMPTPHQPNQPTLSRAHMQSGLDELVRGEHVAFESNSATLTGKSRQLLDRVAALLKRNPEAAVEIGGHTDSYGDPDYNLQLSRTRAESVKKYLLDHAVANRLTAVGYGSTHPLSQDRTRAASKKNRRIEFRVKEER